MYNGEGAGKVIFLCTQTHTPTKSSAMGAKIAFPKARSQQSNGVIGVKRRGPFGA